MINKSNYFQKLKFIRVSSFPNNLKNAFHFTQEATLDHTSWELYDKDKEIRDKVEKYFKLLNEHLNISPKEKITEEVARQYAKSFIRPYVARGDDFESLASGQMGASGGELSARIKSKKIEIDEIKKQKVNFSFPLQKIYNEVKSEKNDNGKKPKKSSKKSQTKPQTEKPQSKPNTSENDGKTIRVNYDNSKPVERIDDEIKFIKRFLSLHNRTKTKQQLLSFINALQRAILEKRIRKTSKYADEIMQIQKQLLTAHKLISGEQKIVIGESAIKKFSAIVGSTRIRTSTQYLKRFIGIQGKTIDKDRAKSLLNTITNALKQNKISSIDPFAQRIKKVIIALKEFIGVARRGETIEVHQEVLNGLDGFLGCPCEEKEELAGINNEPGQTSEVEVMSIEQARQKEFTPVPVTGKWLELIGKFCLPTQFFVYGPGGGGKSSFVLLFMQYLASLGYKILYVAGEQFNTPTFTALLNQLNIIAGDNFKVVGKLETLNPSDFDFVVLDSKDHLMVDLEAFTELMAQYPKQSFVVLSQAVKTGNFTGKERWRNTVDVLIQVENGVARTGLDKNRWGGAGEMLIYDHPSQYLKAV